jgi:hypothetical protein
LKERPAVLAAGVGEGWVVVVMRNYPSLRGGMSGIFLENVVGNECYENLLRYAASVGANLFAHNSMIVRMNSHLQAPQLRFLGLFWDATD